MKIVLLTHEREIDKASNTGCLVQNVLVANCERVIWKRKEPDAALSTLLDQRKAALLFPLNELPADLDDLSSPAAHIVSENIKVISQYSHFVILDATWQQAKKMYRQSLYLQNADKLAFDQVPPSTFRRRRNQREGGLCTAECAIALLKIAGKGDLAEELEGSYERFNSAT